ncbi:hypothetical protein AGOR_G00235140 [Albula goreensis]|uniref:Tetratricopeptide repeat protein 31 n=1 Tax=Albula goreensis TaxID=1534307 RepID=A0A8T3CL01_9TELE|nr:hypothetical protein AGOR_G00235140 [Albula goreensis]
MSHQKDTVSKDVVPGLVGVTEIYEPHLMESYVKIMDLISGARIMASGLDPYDPELFGLDFTNEYYVDNDLYTDGDSDYDEDHNSRKGYCGFNRNFLERVPSKDRGPHPPRPPFLHPSLQLPNLPQRPGFRVVRPTPETFAVPLTVPVDPGTKQSAASECDEVERNARELLDEEERIKEKAEKKRLKKMKQKERKRREKLVKEKDNDNKSKNLKDDPKVEKSSIKSSESINLKNDKQDVDIAMGSATMPTKRKGLTPPLEYRDSSKDLSEEEEDSEEESNTSEPEELDLTSSFVSKAAIIAKRKLELRGKPEKKDKKPVISQDKKEKPKEVQANPQKSDVKPKYEDLILRSLELAIIGNKLASTGCFELAVNYFTDAIKCNPKEFRLFGNRSFCYEKMQRYEKSLMDAEISLTMCPDWIKGLYRKGRALVGLKRYAEAAAVFKQLLKLDSSCIDAAQELMAVQIIQLMEMGFSREQSTNALIIHGTLEKALEALSNIPDMKLHSNSLPTASANQSVEDMKKAPPKPSPPMRASPIKPQPQPTLFPIWVGNLVPSVSEKMLQTIFETVGEIYSLRLLRAKRCAFINYTKDEYCQTAIRKLNGIELEGIKILVRYPDRLHTHQGMSKSAQPSADMPKTAQKSTGECFFWRNNGCIKKSNCIYRHVPEHKGIDRVKSHADAP